MRKRMLWAGLLLVVAQAVIAADDQDHGSQPATSAEPPEAPAQPAAVSEPTQDAQKSNESETKDSGEENGGSDPDCN